MIHSSDANGLDPVHGSLPLSEERRQSYFLQIVLPAFHEKKTTPLTHGKNLFFFSGYNK